MLGKMLLLPEAERLELPVALLKSVDNVGVTASVITAWAAEARRRLAEVRSGVVEPVPWEVAEKRIFDTE
jgi:putative addiction module component (TIGR02574 family)